jgi:phosphohistidine phosphatase SixA
MRSAIATLLTLWLTACSLLVQASAETPEARCAEPARGCKVLICHKELIREVREAYKKGDLVELLRHTWKLDGHPDDEATPLTPKGIEQADAIRRGLIKTGLVPSRVQTSSYLRTRDTAARAIPHKDGQTRSEPATLRKDQCFGEISKFLHSESTIAGNSVYITHSSCLFSALYVDGAPDFVPTGEENYGVMVFLNRKNPRKPIACMWPSDWSLWPEK